MSDGTLITLEGIDASGKSTVWSELQERDPFSRETCFTSEPTDAFDYSNLGDTLDPVETFLCFFQDHEMHRQHVLEPHLDDGHVIICDRYIDSRVAYQGEQMARERVCSEMDVDSFEFIRNYHEDSPTPDLTVYLDISATDSRRRRDREVSEPDVQLQNIREHYRNFIEAEPERFAVVDSVQTIDNVVDDVIASIEQELPEVIDNEATA